MNVSKNEKAFFLLPGFHMQITDKPFLWLVDFLVRSGYRVFKVPIDWKYKTLTTNSKEFVEFYERHKAEENYILGFSYGAVITLMVANFIHPNKIFLCSLSPDFEEDKEWNKKWIRYIGKRRYEDSLTRSATDLAKRLQVSSVIFCGEKESILYPALFKRCSDTVELAKKSKLVMLEDTPHKIDFPEYVKKIKEEILKL